MSNTKSKKKESLKFSLDESIYPLSTIYAASYVFLERAYVYLDRNSKAKVVVTIFSKNKKENLDTLKKDFYNELLNYAHYFSSLKVNAEVVKALMQRALFSASPSLADDAGKKEMANLINDLGQAKNKK